MIYIIIYLIGYILAYYILKYPLKQSNWGDVIMRAWLAVYSWLMVLIVILDLLVKRIIFPNKKLPKPPKWL